MEGDSRPSGFPEIMYRKGDKFRRDTAIWIKPSITRDPKIKWPMGDKRGRVVEEVYRRPLLASPHGN